MDENSPNLVILVRLRSNLELRFNSIFKNWAQLRPVLIRTLFQNSKARHYLDRLATETISYLTKTGCIKSGFASSGTGFCLKNRSLQYINVHPGGRLYVGEKMELTSPLHRVQFHPYGGELKDSFQDTYIHALL
jgi:hypothetical protein